MDKCSTCTKRYVCDELTTYDCAKRDYFFYIEDSEKIRENKANDTQTTNEETIEEILDFSIRVLTNQGREKLICFTNFKGHYEGVLTSDIDLNTGLMKLVLEMDSNGYEMKIINA